MAARDPYGSWSESAQSTLQRYIFNACDPQNYEPNLALNLEVCDLVNAKKGNAPREAAITIVSIVNSRNPNVSILALALLDICVKNCGYPFHLQISTKEFLNELVRRFPERPPVRVSRVQQRILELIEEWRQTICRTSRHKEDLGHIRDMHRLLVYKGYRFPEVRSEDAAVLNPSDNLQSAEEMEEEDREAQSAKLQELIRRGTPQDLQEANRLMKVMAGYDTRHKTDYRAKAAAEVAKVQEKARLLEEMLQGMKPGDQIREGDVFEELANALKSAHPKIQRMCEEESDDTEAVSKLLSINDSIHRTIERYKLLKSGDHDAAARIPQGTLGTTTGVKKTANQEFSLIDLDEALDLSEGGQVAADTAAAGGSSSTQVPDTAAATSTSPDTHQGDLLGLSFSDQTPAQAAAAAAAAASGHAHPLSTSQILANFASGPVSLPVQQNPPATGFTSASLQPQSSAAARNPTSAPDPFASLMQPVASTAASPVQAASPAPASSSLTAGLAGLSLSPSPRPGNAPVQPAQQQSHPLPQSQSQSQSQSQTQTRTATPSQSRPDTSDDDWTTFTSALPASTPSKIEVLSSPIRIEFVSARTDTGIRVQTSFSNTTASPVSELHFQVAIEKSGRDIAPNQQDGVRLEMLLSGIPPGKGSQVKLRYRVSYKLGNEPRESQGHVPPLGVS
ncbi:hypothetical protein KEM52_003540 [Ascosphaera acerosa]|nr:hypothetical protein KEM52_003540 [Ascosphaera acerosa]